MLVEKSWFNIFVEKCFNIFWKMLKHFVMHGLVEK
jgi:hypothetical protein